MTKDEWSATRQKMLDFRKGLEEEKGADYVRDVIDSVNKKPKPILKPGPVLQPRAGSFDRRGDSGAGPFDRPESSAGLDPNAEKVISWALEMGGV